MAIRVRNTTAAGVRVRDYYSDPVSRNGYYGVINHLIRRRDSKSIRSSVFTTAVMQNLKYPQEVRVLREGGGEGASPLLILFHYQFDSNDGCDLFLEANAQGDLTYRFAPSAREGRSLLQKLREFINSSIR